MTEHGVSICLCGKEFTQLNAYNRHQRSCTKTKKRLSGALEKAKAIWDAKKHRRLDDTVPAVTFNSTDMPTGFESSPWTSVVGEANNLDEVSSIQLVVISRDSTQDHKIQRPQEPDENNSVPLSEGRPRRLNRRLPKRYRDILPEAAPALPPNLPPLPDSSSSSTVGDTHILPPLVRKLFRTPRNIFGLVRQYFSKQLPTVDPEELVTLADLSSTATGPPAVKQLHNSAVNFYPFPNESSFRLSDWYWNGGIQKSQQSFKNLIDIIGGPDFDPNDVRDTKWDKINATLGNNAEDGVDGEWMDEDAGWTKSRIKISVPFHSRMANPGPRDYLGADMYHRSLVAVIRERIADPHTGARFHMEPYELRWKPTNQREEVRMHGEIYTSEAFIQAHRALQDSPGEPDCELPRVVVAMMFWSDATHLTSFGNSHLWPCYLFFGNESKYRRCKPSCNLCSHVAYFQKVRWPPISKYEHIHSVTVTRRVQAFCGAACGWEGS